MLGPRDFSGHVLHIHDIANVLFSPPPSSIFLSVCEKCITRNSRAQDHRESRLKSRVPVYNLVGVLSSCEPYRNVVATALVAVFVVLGASLIVYFFCCCRTRTSYGEPAETMNLKTHGRPGYRSTGQADTNADSYRHSR